MYARKRVWMGSICKRVEPSAQASATFAHAVRSRKSNPIFAIKPAFA